MSDTSDTEPGELPAAPAQTIAGRAKQSTSELKTGPLGDVTGEIAPEHRVIRYVPAHATPGPVRIGAAIIGVLAGVCLGVACDDMLSSSSTLTVRQIQSIASSCVANPDDCTNLSLTESSASVSAKMSVLALGMLLLFVYAALEFWPMLWDALGRVRKTGAQ